MIRKLLLSILILVATQALAAGPTKTQIFKLEGANVRMAIPAGWQIAPGYLGVPLMIMGPTASGGRPVIGVTPTGKKVESLPAQELDRNQRDYQKGREAWLGKRGGRSIAYVPYREEKWNGGLAASVIGYRYRLQGQDFVESSHYVVCRGQLFHISSLVRGAHEARYANEVSDVVRSFQCE